MITVGVRLALSVRRLRFLTEMRHRQAITDDLTGLGNRRQLFNLLDAFFADNADPETVDRHLSLLYIDLDHFKEINDSFGHSAGDDVLRQLGPRLTRHLRETDVLVRVGGDELAVLVMDDNSEFAATIAERLIAELEQPFVLDALSVRVGASIGIASAPVDATDGIGLLRCADLAMYRAKVGPSPFEMYRHDVDDDGNRLQLVDELHDAIDGRSPRSPLSTADRSHHRRELGDGSAATLASSASRTHASARIHSLGRGRRAHALPHRVRPRASGEPNVLPGTRPVGW